MKTILDNLCHVLTCLWITISSLIIFIIVLFITLDTTATINCVSGEREAILHTFLGDMRTSEPAGEFQFQQACEED